MSAEKLKNKLHNALKLSGFVVRREFCDFIIKRFNEEHIDLSDNNVFDSCIKNICTSLEKQCKINKSIEENNIKQAIEMCLHLGHDKNETVFNVIDAFSVPKLHYDPDKKTYSLSKTKSSLLPGALSKIQLFEERYMSVLQRTQRNFRNKVTENESDRLVLQTVDYLLTSTSVTLDHTLILGSLSQVSEGKYFLEDPSGMVELDLTHAKYYGGFFVENSMVLVNGHYEDKILRVSTIILPPGEEYKDSRITFGNLNYFGGLSEQPLRDSRNLLECLHSNPSGIILFFSDVWLDHPLVFEKLEYLFGGFNEVPPTAFVFMGNFLEDTLGVGKIIKLKNLFKQFGELVSKFHNLVSSSNFVFVPGMSDPAMPHIVPRLALPSFVSSEFTKYVPKAIFTTNPCRLQYCVREIAIFRADVLVKLMQDSLHKPEKEEIGDCVTRTIISQGHLSPLSLNALTVHWQFDYTLRLYPLPNLIVIGDKSESYVGKYKGCQIVNPGSFCENNFQFQSYIPATEQLDECIL